MPQITIVTSLYKSAPYIEAFHSRHLDCIKSIGISYEFVFVNDGSPDNSAEITRGLITRHPNITLIQLSRNFGQHAAMFAGLARAQGEYVYAADCDLEEEPENILTMFEMLRNDPDLDVVYGVTKRRTAGFMINVLSDFFYFFLNLLSEVTIPPNQTWQRIMTQQYVRELLKYQEIKALPAGLMALVGFNQAPLVVTRTFKGTTTYSFIKRTMLALSTFIAFSTKPLSWVCIAGLILACISFAFIITIITTKLLGYDFQTGWSSIVASIWCVGGLILFSIGIVGTYLARVFEQVKHRPQYVVKKIVSSLPNTNDIDFARVS